MSRWKGKARKTKKILIRVNNDDKALAEKLSKAEGKNTSEFFRGLLHEHETKIDIREEIAFQFKIHVNNYTIKPKG
jgi:uncharacterized protein (DUF1778 family)